MLEAPFFVLALAAGDCDARATLAGELMFLRQSGTPTSLLRATAEAASDPGYAQTLVRRVLVTQKVASAEARDLAAYHFAAEVHAECDAASAVDAPLR